MRVCVKTFTSTISYDDIELQINKFMIDLTKDNIIDIKTNITSVLNHGTILYSAMITYIL